MKKPKNTINKTNNNNIVAESITLGSQIYWLASFCLILAFLIYYLNLDYIYILTFIFIYINLYLILTNILKRFFKNHLSLLDFYIQLSTTFIAVFLAVYISNKEKTDEEYLKYISLINNAKTEVSSTMGSLNRLRGIAIKQYDSTSNKTLYNNIIPYPTQIDFLLNTETFFMEISNPALKYLLQARYNLQNIKFNIQTEFSRQTKNFGTKVTLEEFLYINDLLQYYAQQLDLTREILQQEIHFQNDKFNELKFLNILDTLEQSHRYKPILKIEP